MTIRTVVVDDVPDIRVLLSIILQAHGGFEVMAEVGTGQEGIDAAAEHKPDLLILDLAMPDMDGLEVLPQVLAASPQTAVVVLTGYERDDITKAAIAAGALGCLNKRVAGPDLAGALLDLLGTRSC